MRWRDRMLIAAAMSSVSSVASVSIVPAFAQTDMAHADQAVLAMPAALQSPMPALRRYVTEPSGLTSTVEVPPNVAVPRSFRAIVESMLERSAMFRRQCRRIANTAHLQVRLRNAQEAGISGRARTLISRTRDGRIVATASIKPLDNAVELIAHELEHVIEHLDGVNFDALAALSGTGVHQAVDGSFETTRAVHVGRTVAREAGTGR